MSDLTRRTFLKLMGASGAFVVYGCDRRPLVEPVDAVPAGWVRGEERFVPSTCLQCPSGCGITVRVYEGRAIKIDGNPAHPLNAGRLCPKGQAGLQVLYDPDRIRGPMKKVGGRGSRQYQSISWEQAIGDVADRLRHLRESGHAHAALVMSGRASEPMRLLLERFAAAYGTPNLVDASSLSDHPIRLANECTMGVADHLGYDLENTNYLLCFGANFLEGWRPTTYLLRMYAAMRRGRPGRRPKIVMVDPRFSVGASKADEWIPIRPGTDAALALGIAHVLIKERLHDASFVADHTSGFDRFAAIASEYTPEHVEAVTGVAADTVVRIAREFASAKPAVAAAGRGAALHTNGLFNCMAVNALNALAGSIDVPGGVVVQRKPPLAPLAAPVLDETARQAAAAPRIDGVGSGRFPLAASLHSRLPEAMLARQPYPVEMAFVYYTNPLFSGPQPSRYREAFSRIPYIVSFSPFMDETTELADIILPDHTYLERFDLDLISPSLGYPVLNVRQPVVDPLYATQNTGDVLIAIAQRVGGAVGQSFPWRDYHACLDALVADIAASSEGSFTAEGPAEFRRRLGETGVWTAAPYRFGEWDRVLATRSRRYEFESEMLRARAGDASGQSDDRWLPHFEPPAFAGNAAEYPFYLNTFRTMTHAEGRGGNQPWLQDSYGVQLNMAWEAWAALNPNAARALGIDDGDFVWVESPAGRLRVRARHDPATAPDVLSMPFEYGHTAYGRWAKSVPGNPNDITSAAMRDDLTGSAALNATRVKVYRG